tara:strand:- start:222 stop:647 length:426 start_codon:yes stop_codon:yes gene_type:complete
VPRLPVDGKKVQEFRLTLGTFERERIDTLITAIAINRVSTPLVALLSDVSALSALALAYGYYKYGDEFKSFMKDNYDNLGDLVNDFLLFLPNAPDLNPFNNQPNPGVPSSESGGGGLSGLIQDLINLVGNDLPQQGNSGAI